MAATGLGLAAVLFAIVSSRISFGSQFKEIKITETTRKHFDNFKSDKEVSSFLDEASCKGR